MIRPSKHAHPDRTVIGVSVVLLRRLKRLRLENYDSLRNFAKKSIVGADFLYLPALNLLYVLGLIEYRPKTDSFEYVGPDETF